MARIDEIDRRTDVVFVLFYLAEQVRGVTKLQKMLFLVEQETEFFVEYDSDIEFDFAPHEMGPFSEEVYSELEFLLQLSALESEPLDTPQADSDAPLANESFRITPKGEKIARQLVGQLKPEHREELRDLVTEYNSMPLTELLQYVQSTYPDFAAESETKVHVLSEAQ